MQINLVIPTTVNVTGAIWDSLFRLALSQGRTKYRLKPVSRNERSYYKLGVRLSYAN